MGIINVNKTLLSVGDLKKHVSRKSESCKRQKRERRGKETSLGLILINIRRAKYTVHSRFLYKILVKLIILKAIYSPCHSHVCFRGRPCRFFGSSLSRVSGCPVAGRPRFRGRFLPLVLPPPFAINASTSSLAPASSDSGIHVSFHSIRYCLLPLTIFWPIILRIPYR
jgi:hypothetical protein